jgi:hypothetical protein
MNTDKLTPEQISDLHKQLRRDSAELDVIMFSATPKWTQDEAIAFESARDCINGMIAVCSRAIADEKSKPEPDELRMSELKNYVHDLARERRELHVTDYEKIETIRREYGSLLRAHRAKSAPALERR